LRLRDGNGMQNGKRNIDFDIFAVILLALDVLSLRKTYLPIPIAMATLTVVFT
jgi:hypothetical protein